MSPVVPDLLLPVVDSPERAGVLCDFDGTLSSIVPDPATVVPLPGVAATLGSLAHRLGVAAVVSGRPVSFLAAHLGEDGPDLWGLYGLEHLVAGDGSRVVEADAEAEPWRGMLDEAVARATAELGPAGVGVEHKGLSLTLHYRNRPALQTRVAEWASTEAGRSGLVAHPAKMSWELRVPVARDKGWVVARVATGLEAVVFLGDDVGDLSAFDALDDLAAAGCHTVGVAVAGPEAPGELLERADLVVTGPEAAVELLAALAAAVSTQPRSTQPRST